MGSEPPSVCSGTGVSARTSVTRIDTYDLVGTMTQGRGQSVPYPDRGGGFPEWVSELPSRGSVWTSFGVGRRMEHCPDGKRLGLRLDVETWSG